MDFELQELLQVHDPVASGKDDETVAQGKRSAALGYGRNMITSFFPSGFARHGHAKPEGKKELGWVGPLPRAAASAALPWAIRLLPLRGAGKVNQRAGGGGGMSALFGAGRPRPAAPHRALGEGMSNEFRLSDPVSQAKPIRLLLQGKTDTGPF